MTRPSPYFMHDQARRRVARIMRDYDRRPMVETIGASPVWPLIALIAALTFINVLSAIPGS